MPQHYRSSKHVLHEDGKTWELSPYNGDGNIPPDSFLSDHIERRMALQDASDEIMHQYKIPSSEDFRKAKDYKERIRNDNGGIWVMKALTNEERPTARASHALVERIHSVERNDAAFCRPTLTDECGNIYAGDTKRTATGNLLRKPSTLAISD